MRGQFEAADCKIFTYIMMGEPRSMKYFSNPEKAMDSPDAMLPWAALALDCALQERTGKQRVKLLT